MHNTHALINVRKHAQGDLYTHQDQSPPNQYTRRTSTTVTTPSQYKITTLTPIRRDRTNLPPPPRPPPYVPHTVGPTKSNQTDALLLPILGAVLSLLVRGIPVTNTRPRTLIRVSDTRDRVLCSKRHGENNDAFRFCQWWAEPSTYDSKDGDTALLCIGE